MKTLLSLEESAQFILGLVLYSQLGSSWWWFAGLFFAPDFGMLGYLINPKVGAFTYNLTHHKALALLVYLMGIYLENDLLQASGLLLFTHAAFDRIFGFGLKYTSAFKDTHLGSIGNNHS